MADRRYGASRAPERRNQGRPPRGRDGYGRTPPRRPPTGRPSKSGAFTLPNLLSVLRLVCAPVFLWAALGAKDDTIALAVLVVAGLTDLLDGWLARTLRQLSRVGEILDPAADRLFMLAVALGLALRGVVPWWAAALLPLRDLLLLGLVPALRSRGVTALPVHVVGKAATCGLFVAFPLLLVAYGIGPITGQPTHVETAGQVARALGWAFAGWGIGLHWWAGVLYLGQVRQLLATMPPMIKGGPGRA